MKNSVAHMSGLCLALVITFAVAAYGQNQEVDEICLGCICIGASNCNQTLTCSGDVCGLFRITWPYWADAGKPVLEGDNPNDAGAYARCVNEPYCAGATVRGYMRKYPQDCNGDGAINCDDYARIHLLGRYGCGGRLSPIYESRYNACMAQVG